jgi:uncharacterized protein YegP (UPF0339 family)
VKNVDPVFEVKKNVAGEWIWTLKDNRNQVLAVSGQGYKEKDDCENSITEVKNCARTATVR